MALTDMDALYGFALPASSYDDSASPNSDNEDAFNVSEDASGSQGGVNDLGEAGANESVEHEGKRKSRRPPSTAERRATHNAVERARRESLNGRFMELASALPSMAAVKRPSKSVIVAKSLEYVYATEDRERVLRAENASLRKEVDELRAKLGMAPSISAAISASPAILMASPRVDRERNNSMDDSASSLLGCSPISSGGSFESPLPNGQPLGPTNPAYNAAFARAMLPTNTDLNKPPLSPTDANQMLNASTSSSLPVSAMPFHLGLPAAVHPLAAYDSNYLLAFSMQQQHQAAMQQQNALNMAMSSSMPGWSGYNFGMHNMNHPVASGVDYPGNLVFA